MRALEYSGSVLKMFEMKMPSTLHEHFRQGARAKVIAPLTAKRFAIALQMPNLDSPIVTLEQMVENQNEILAAANTPGFRVPMTGYLTPTLSPKEVARMCTHKDFAGLKYYPFGLTTKAEYGIKDPTTLWKPGSLPYQCLQVLDAHKKVFLVHAADGIARKNTTIRTRHYRDGDELDAYDQEPHFVEHTLPYIRDAHPELKISFEHLSTIEGVQAVRQYGGSKLGCSITPQHLLTDRRDTHRGGLRPHNFWFPAPQAFEHRQELNKFAAEFHPYTWLGSDSAPHYLKKKEADCCAGGVMTAHACIELYVEAFDKIGAITQSFENFASTNGPRFFGFEPSIETITLKREKWKVKELFYVEEDDDVEPMRPFRLGEDIEWKLVAA